MQAKEFSLSTLEFQGKKNPGTDRSSVLSFLDKVKKAKEMKIDRWFFLSYQLKLNYGLLELILRLHYIYAFEFWTEM